VKKVTFILLLILIGFYSKAQKQTAIGLKVFLSKDLNKYTDEGNLILGNFPGFNPVSYGFYIERQLVNDLFGEIGIADKTYWLGYKINPNIDKISPSPSSISSYQFQVLLKYKLNLYKFLLVKPNIGIVFCTNQDYTSKRSSKTGNPNYFTYEVIKSDFVKGFVLGHLGIDMELKLTKKLSFVINSGILKGIKTVAENNISYLLKDSIYWKTAKATNKGDYWYTGLSIKYNFLL